MTRYTGIGFRKDFADEFLNTGSLSPSFVEVSPENWMGIGGYWKKVFNQVAQKYPVLLHGLSLSIGSPDEIDYQFLEKVRVFIREYNIKIYSEHLSFSKCDNAHLYDLLPIPFCKEAVQHVSEKIARVQDYLQMEIAMEIVSYYTPIAAEMSEAEFITDIVTQSGCKLLLDVNNVFVNSFNHRYDANKFIDWLPLDKVAYIHMAGHEKIAEDLIIDTHGQPIIDPVYNLFEYTVQKMSDPVPVLLERDFNIPDLKELQAELDRLDKICKKKWTYNYATN